MKHVINAQEAKVGRINYYYVRCSCGELRFALALRHVNSKDEIIGYTRAQAKVIGDIRIRKHRKDVDE